MGAARVGLERAGVGEPDAVVAHLAEQPGSGQVSQSGETRDDLVVGVGSERGGGGLFQSGGGSTGGVHHGRQRQSLVPEGVFDQGGLAQVLGA